MLHGHNIIGQETGAAGKETLSSFSTLLGAELPEAFSVATEAEIKLALEKAAAAAPVYAALPADKRAEFLEAIAAEIQALGPDLIERAKLESGLPEGRLNGERDRTVNQLKLFATILREGSWVEAIIDTAQPDRKPLPRADLRRMLLPLGPVAVFAASNFPFAFSTAGGDTASALAAGCPVIVKAHTSHLGTNEMMASAIQRAAKATGMPDGVFSSLVGPGSSLGQTLARQEAIKAIGFTGSYRAGMSLFHTAATERKSPIPVYAEMSSINPVILLPGKLAADAAAVAKQLAGSITLGVGQFCTNPGLLFLLRDKASEAFVAELKTALEAVPAATMLNKTICSSYYKEKSRIAQLPGVTAVVDNPSGAGEYKGSAALLQVSATDFMKEEAMQEEIFGPASLLVWCNSAAEMETALGRLHGQLTGSVYGNAADHKAFAQAIAVLSGKVGRLIYDNVPTGVEVCHAMVHGGPFPATTDGRSTSVGGEAIKRFLRPICLQDCPEQLLPSALQNANPLGIMRKLNGRYTREAISSI